MVLSLALLVRLAFTLLRQGSRLARTALLLALVAGGSVELIVHGPLGLLQPHTAPPNGVTGANVLFVYPVAWAAALLISRPAVFSAGGGRQGSVGDEAGPTRRPRRSQSIRTRR